MGVGKRATTVTAEEPRAGGLRLSSASLVARNALYNFLSTGTLVLLALFCTPYIVHHLGASRYGLFALVSVVAGYFAMLDLGLVQAVMKYASEYYGRGDLERLGRLIGTANLIYLGLGLVGAALIAALTPLLVTRVLHLEVALRADARFVLYLSALGFLVNMPLSVFNALPAALQRMDITNARATLIGVGTSLGSVALLALGYGLREVMGLTVALSALGVVVFVFASRRLLPGVSFRPRVDREEARRLFALALPTALSSAGSRAVSRLDRILVGSFWPVQQVTYYTVPVDMCSRGSSLTNQVTRALFPAVSDRSANGEAESVQRIYLRATRLLNLAVVPVMLLFVLFAYPVLHAWMGDEFARRSALLLALAAGAFCFRFLSDLQNMFLLAMGHAGLMAKWNLAQGAGTVLLNLLLIPRWGALGAALSLFVVSAGTVLPYTCLVSRRIIGVPMHRTVWLFVLPVLLSLGCFLPFLPLLARVRTLAPLGLAFLGLGALYLLVGGLLRALPREDLVLAWQVVRGGGRPA